MKFYLVKKRTLLLIAGIVWLIAGFNVARLGIISYLNIEIKWFYFLLSALVFLAFGTMFFNMTRKHTKRIKAYEDRRKEICSVFAKIYQGFDPDPKTLICDGCSCDKENPTLLDPN